MESLDKERLKEKLALLPDKPGCYLMKDESGNVIYVGKANVLKNRVRSYFTGSHDGKTQRLVQQIRDFEYIVTRTPQEALLLEYNLIQQYKPHYNVMYKDDKSYPYIVVTKEKYPRIEVTRKVKKERGKYFGPYPNAGAAQETKRLLDKLYPLRKCRTLPDRACLYYHLGQCLAPCIQDVDAAVFEEMVEEITRFLQGGYKDIQERLRREMEEAAENLEFERAKELRDQIQSISAIMEPQHVSQTDGIDRDVLAYAADRGWMCVQVFFVRQGRLIQREAATFAHYGEPEDDFVSFVTQFYHQRQEVLPREILLPSQVEEQAKALDEWLPVKVSFPKRGGKRQLVLMAEENARIALEEKFRLEERDEARTWGALEQLAEALGIGIPRRIEAFDNSNIQGADPVSAMVVFTDGRPDKKEYRKYKIRTVQGPDDYETMREVIRRRYIRVLKENLPLPDLIVVDGGKGQIAAAVDVLENELGLYIPVCGLAKDERHRTERLFMGDPPEEIPLPRHSPAFYLLQRIQDEVHRFAISFHRQRRGKSMLKSQLDDIPGVGEKRKRLLWKHFGSLERMREATVEEYRQIGIGDKLAREILRHLRERTDQLL